MVRGLRKAKAFSLTIFIAITILVAGCAGVSERAKSLDVTTRAYEKGLRWGKFDEARAFKAGPQQFLTNSERRRLQNIHVTGYDLINSSVSPDHSNAILMVRIRYVNDNDAIEKTFIDRQTWHYDQKLQRWQLESPIPSFR